MNILSNEDIIEYGKMISILSKRVISNKAVAEEAAQEVWVRVLGSLSSFREESKMSTWIYTIARRVIGKYVVNENRHTASFLHDFITGDDLEIPVDIDMEKNLWVKSECDRCLTGLFHCLSNEARMIYIFRDVIQLPFGEVAAIMDMDEGAVRKTLSRSRARLRSFLNGNCRIFNPNSECKCRMNTLLEGIDLPGEYQRIRDIGKRVSIFRQAEEILPTKNYWEKHVS
ncbi:MAG: RNA polymerase sigma factor [Treponema sp.]|nr:RNA polymerase sigma factor [Treponema sp.]